MKKINLREFYPALYQRDYFCDVPDEVAEVLEAFRRREWAHRRRVYRYKANYSLDRNDGIENEALYVESSAEAQFERIISDKNICYAMKTLSHTQLRRLYAFAFLDMNYATIAKIEGVSFNAVKKSIGNAVVTILQTINFF